MRTLALALLACCKGSAHRDETPVITPAMPLELRCDLEKPAPPPHGVPAVVGGKRVWLDLATTLSVTGEHGLVAAIPIPAKPQAVFGGAATKRGTAIVARAGGAWWLAQVDDRGAPRGTPVELKGITAEAGKVGAFDDTVVLVEQSHEHAQLAMVDLDGAPRGDAIELGIVDVDDLARVPGSHLFAVLQREHAGEPAKLRLFDADQRAFTGPSTATGVEIVVAMVPFDGALLVAGIQNKRLVAAKLDGKGALTAWKDLAPADEASVLAMPDGTHAFAAWVDAEALHVAQLHADLGLGVELAHGGDGDGPSVASETTLYVRGRRFTCR